ncbi:proteasome inhibitor PI31 subunit isoform X2 [Protopterus annectens]|uniref:proteasome inhibitor PI31 subunit isoform X2 n=1 Tax=Protopterus annectens TaxID=7888 RepID=UPI001CF9E11A|nr:proteasome inhibitor PI31 subunit isoform X2 [Protopterus annectens]
MAGLELLYELVESSISCPQDAFVCFLHWEIVSCGYKCVGTGDAPRVSKKKSESLPANWNASPELYTLYYVSDDDKNNLLAKVITADDSLIINVMNPETEQVADLTVNISDYIDSDNLHDFSRVFSDKRKLKKLIKSSILSPLCDGKEKQGTAAKQRASTHTETIPEKDYDSDPLRIPFAGRYPRRSDPPDPLAPFVTGGADRDPFGRAGSDYVNLGSNSNTAGLV